jgi:hypothetical protein
MNEPQQALVVIEGNTAETRGLARLGAPELSVDGVSPELVEQAKIFLDSLARSIVRREFSIFHGTTVQCGFWPVRFDQEGAGKLVVHEPDKNNEKWVRGASHALWLWKEQLAVCREAGSVFEPAIPKSFSACSAGVLDSSEAVSGVRYIYSGERSGWFLSTRLHETNPDAVKMIHTYHVVGARPEVAKFLALAPGFCFDQQSGRTWLDEELLAEEAW